MSNQKNFKTYKLTLTANVEQKLNVQGMMYAIVEASNVIQLEFDEGNRITNAGAGSSGEFQSNYSTVTVKSTQSQTVVIILGFGKYRAAGGGITVGALNATIEPSTNMVTRTDRVCTSSANEGIAFDSSVRREVMICVPSDQPNAIRVGPSVINQDRGLIVEPGTTLTLSLKGELFGRSLGADVKVSVLELNG